MSALDAAAHRAAVRRCLVVVTAPVVSVTAALAGRAAGWWAYPDADIGLLLAGTTALGVLLAVVDVVLDGAADAMVRGVGDRP